MGTPLNRGGREVVTLGFPPNAYNEFKRRILTLGSLLMPDELGLLTSSDNCREPMLPVEIALSSRTFDHGKPGDEDYIIGVTGVELTMQLGPSKTKEPKSFELLGGIAVVSAVEPYVQGPYGNEELELWRSRGVELPKRSRRLKYWYKTRLRNVDGDELVVLDQPPLPGGKAVSADPAWLDARALTQGTNVDYQWMISKLDTMIADQEQPKADE